MTSSTWQLDFLPWIPSRNAAPCVSPKPKNHFLSNFTYSTIYIFTNNSVLNFLFSLIPISLFIKNTNYHVACGARSLSTPFLWPVHCFFWIDINTSRQAQSHDPGNNFVISSFVEALKLFPVPLINFPVEPPQWRIAVGHQYVTVRHKFKIVRIVSCYLHKEDSFKVFMDVEGGSNIVSTVYVGPVLLLPASITNVSFRTNPQGPGNKIAHMHSAMLQQQ